MEAARKPLLCWKSFASTAAFLGRVGETGGMERGGGGEGVLAGRVARGGSWMQLLGCIQNPVPCGPNSGSSRRLGPASDILSTDPNNPIGLPGNYHKERKHLLYIKLLLALN